MVMPYLAYVQTLIKNIHNPLIYYNNIYVVKSIASD